jgi:O-antigen/teichoic acid export membrane protein
VSQVSSGSSTRILKNGAWNAAAALVTGVVSFLLVPFLLHKLGTQLYGVWVLIGSIFAYSSVFHFGLSSAINRYIPLGLARGNDDEIRRIASTGTVFFSAIGMVVVVLTVVVYFNITRWFNVPEAAAASARHAVLVVGLLLGITVLSQTFGAILSGYQRYDLTAGSRLVMCVARALALVVALTAGGGLLAVALIYGLTELGINVIQFGFARRLMPDHAVSLASFDAGLLREMLGYGLNTFLYGTGAVIAYKASELIIGVFMQAEDVARYSVAAGAVLMVTTLIDSLSAAIKPAVSDLDARDESQQIRRLSLLSQKYTLFLIVPSTAFLVFMGREFLHVWTGLSNPDLALVVTMLALGQAFRLAQHSNFLVLVGKGEHRFFGFCVLLIGLGTVTLSTLAVGVFRLGLVGAGMASFISWAVVCGIVIPAHVNAQLAVTGRERWANVVTPVLTGCMPCVVLMMAWKYVHPPDTWAEIMAVVVVSAVVTLIAVWHGLTLSERNTFRGLAKLRGLGNSELNPARKHS